MGQDTIVTGVIGDDIHIIGLKALDFYLRKAGYKVVSLGVMVSQEEFIEAAVETKASAIMISSLNGHGEIHCKNFRKNCAKAGLRNILLYIGGNLVVGTAKAKDIETRFKKNGFDRVYLPGASMSSAISDLKQDLS